MDLQQEWNAVVSAPILFGAAIVVVGAVIWKLMDWRYGGQIETLRERLAFAQDRLAVSAREAAQASAQLEKAEEQRKRPPTMAFDEKPITAGSVIDILKHITVGNVATITATGATYTESEITVPGPALKDSDGKPH